MNTIEAIRAEIERRIKEYDAIIESQPDSNRSERDAWKWAEDKSLLSFIDSLPEETAPKGYDEAYLNECIAKASKTWDGVDVDKYMDEVRGNRLIISNGSLEDEMINYWGRIPDDKDLIDTARHFALWQKEQMMDEWLQDRDGCFWDGVEEGKKAMEKQMMKDGNVILAEEDFDAEKEKSMEWGYNLCKEQMMKEAVEGEVYQYHSYNRDATAILVDIPKENLGEKVRIIIITEDKR